MSSGSAPMRMSASSSKARSCGCDSTGHSSLHIRPNCLCGVYVKRVKRDEVESESAREAGDELANALGVMNLMPIDDEKNWCGGADLQASEEVDEHRCIDSALTDHEVELAASADSRQHVEGEATAGGRDDRRLARRRPDRSLVIVRADGRLVGKVAACAQRFSLRTNGGRKGLRFPASHQRNALSCCQATYKAF